MEDEAAATLMSLSAPLECNFASRMLAFNNKKLSWSSHRHKRKKPSYNGSTAQLSPTGTATASIMATSLPAHIHRSFDDWEDKFASHGMAGWQPRLKFGNQDVLMRANFVEETASSSSSDVVSPHRIHPYNEEIHSEGEVLERNWRDRYHPKCSPLDDLCAAVACDQDKNLYPNYLSAKKSSHPISIPRLLTKPSYHGKNEHWSFSRPRHELEQDERDDRHDSSEGYYPSPDFKHRARLASVGSSDTGSEYGGLGRKHLEEFIRMEISASTDSDRYTEMNSRYIGSYSPSARRKRIERFMEKRKCRVWSKKVDYDVRKIFANSRLRVKGRFVKKEDEELLCHLMSFA